MRTRMVESTFARALSYNRRSQRLTIRTHPGRRIRHVRVPFALVEEMLKAESIGRFYNQYIRSAYATVPA